MVAVDGTAVPSAEEVRQRRLGNANSVDAMSMGPAVTELSRLVPELDELLKAKPNATIAVVQGSYDWVHRGHLNLIAGIAAHRVDGEPYDMVLVVPTAEYDRKPFLQHSFGRREALLKEAVAAEPALRDGRTIVSDVSKLVGGTPSDLMKALVRAYPSGRFSYALAADSFNDSPRWPDFRFIEENAELIAVNRAGYELADPTRASQVVAVPPVEISSTEIRQAVRDGTVTALQGRVPEATLRLLEREISIPGATSDIARTSAFDETRARIPDGGIDLLAQLNAQALPAAVRQRLERVQDDYSEQLADTRRLRFSVDPRGVDPTKGYTAKRVYNAHDEGRFSGRYLFKVLTPEIARKVEFLTALERLAGLDVPLATYHVMENADPLSPPEHGVMIRWNKGVDMAFDFDASKAPPDVLETLMVSRWFNEVVGNLDVWRGQFLMPKAAAEHHQQIIHIDPDNAFLRRSPEWVQSVLKDHFHIAAPLSACGWTDKPFDFKEAVGWAPDHYDSMATMYGPLMRDYVTGKCDIDLKAVRERIAEMKQVPDAALLNVMSQYLDTSWRANNGFVPVQGANAFMSREEFGQQLVERIGRSVDEFSAFLTELERARNNPQHPIYQKYRDIEPWGY